MILPDIPRLYTALAEILVHLSEQLNLITLLNV